MSDKLEVFADLVDLADSGATEGRIPGNGIWRLQEVVNDPGKMVFTSRGSSWCYEIGELKTNAKLREAIKRTASQRRDARQRR